MLSFEEAAEGLGLRIEATLEPGQEINRTFKAIVTFHTRWLGWLDKLRGPPAEVLLQQVTVEGQPQMISPFNGITLAVLRDEYLNVDFGKIEQHSDVLIRMTNYGTETHHVHLGIGGVMTRPRDHRDRFECDGPIDVTWEPFSGRKKDDA